MIIFNLMIIALLIFSVILLSGVKIMYNSKYIQLIMFIFIMYTPILTLIEGYKLGHIGINITTIIIIIISLIAIWGYNKNKHRYFIHNVKQKEVINIIEKYLERKNIKYEVIDDEIYLSDINNSIFVYNSMELMQINLDCKEIKDMDFYNDIIKEVRDGIKEIKKRHFSIEGIFNLIIVAFLYWARVNFIK